MNSSNNNSNNNISSLQLLKNKSTVDKTMKNLIGAAMLCAFMSVVPSKAQAQAQSFGQLNIGGIIQTVISAATQNNRYNNNNYNNGYNNNGYNNNYQTRYDYNSKQSLQAAYDAGYSAGKRKADPATSFPSNRVCEAYSDGYNDGTREAIDDTIKAARNRYNNQNNQYQSVQYQNNNSDNVYYYSGR